MVGRKMHQGKKKTSGSPLLSPARITESSVIQLPGEYSGDPKAGKTKNGDPDLSSCPTKIGGVPYSTLLRVSTVPYRFRGWDALQQLYCESSYILHLQAIVQDVN